MRAIDADRLQKQFDEKSTNPNYRVNMHNIKSIISNAPTVLTIPDNPTNGDVLQAVFPCNEVYINKLQEGVVHFSMKSNPTSLDCFNTDWWNAPYKENKDGEY